MAADMTDLEPTRPLAKAAEILKDVPHEPGAKKPDPIVVADGIVRGFGGLKAVDVEYPSRSNAVSSPH